MRSLLIGWTLRNVKAPIGEGGLLGGADCVGLRGVISGVTVPEYWSPVGLLAAQVLAATDTQTGTNGAGGTNGAAGNPGVNGGTGGDGQDVNANASRPTPRIRPRPLAATAAPGATAEQVTRRGQWGAAALAEPAVMRLRPPLRLPSPETRLPTPRRPAARAVPAVAPVRPAAAERRAREHRGRWRHRDVDGKRHEPRRQHRNIHCQCDRRKWRDGARCGRDRQQWRHGHGFDRFLDLGRRQRDGLRDCYRRQWRSGDFRRGWRTRSGRDACRTPSRASTTGASDTQRDDHRRQWRQ